ncbi:MAG: cbb3-type cytochrome c oxidase subunit I, partial [Sphingomicrobium sp.]
MNEMTRVRKEDERLARERKKIVRDGPKLTGAELEARLERAWRRPPGILGWLATVDHKEIGRRYIVTALLFLAAGGILALLMRLQLARPESHILGPDAYNQTFTVHGTAM